MELWDIYIFFLLFPTDNLIGLAEGIEEKSLRLTPDTTFPLSLIIPAKLKTYTWGHTRKRIRESSLEEKERE